MIGKRSERSDDWDKFRTLLLYESWPKYYSARSVLAFLTRANIHRKISAAEVEAWKQRYYKKNELLACIFAIDIM
jgi:hypothetical protein